MRIITTLLFFAPLTAGPVESTAGSTLGRDDGALDVLAAQPGSMQVTRRPARDGGEDSWSVVASRAPLDRLLQEIGRRSGDRIEGLHQLDGMPRVTVELRARPLPLILEYVLGSVGLRFSQRQGTITILVPSAVVPVEEALDQAAVAWIRASARFPDDPSAPLARLAQGELLELREQRSAALFQYQMLIESFPDSPLIDDAYMRSGRILEREGRWSEAMKQFRDLAELGTDAAYKPAARLEIARCQIELGDPQSAIYLLETLETNYPTVDPVERAGRLLVRASALNALGRFREALDELTSASPELDSMANREAIKVRAISFEGMRQYAEASRAWLTYGRSASPLEKEAALRQAARLALLAPDQEAAVLFICKEAEEIPARESFDEFKREAERRLGLREDQGPVTPVPRDRIAFAEGWLDAGEVEKATKEFEVLFLTRNTLEDADLVARVCVGWARCEESRRGLEAAIQILAEARSELETLSARSRLDLGAAALFEKHDLYDRAVEAYAGRY